MPSRQTAVGERWEPSLVGEFFAGPTHKIRDAVWGDVPVDKAVRALLETETMSRLKGLGQLDFAPYAFPTARHTRFEHATGVYYLARLALKRIVDSGAYLADADVRRILAASLLRDAGRYPRASALEDLTLPGLTGRDEVLRRRVEETEVAGVLSEGWDLEPHGVFRLISRDEPPRNATPTEHLARDLLSGSLDAATLDRLKRDAQGAKVPYGALDVEALISSLRVVGEGNRAVLAVDEPDVGHLQSLVFAGYLMRYNVYGNHALRAPAAMFLRAAQDAVQAEEMDFDELTARDDAGASTLLQESADPKGSSAVLVRRLRDRRPYKRALELDERHPNYASLIKLRSDASWRRRIEEAWARYLTRYRKGTAGPSDILLDLPEKENPKVRLRIIRRFPGFRPDERNLVDWQSVSGLSDEDMARYHAPLHRLRVFTANDDLAASVRRHADELFAISEEVG